MSSRTKLADHRVNPTDAPIGGPWPPSLFPLRWEPFYSFRLAAVRTTVVVVRSPS